ncbi:hypothetical protein EMIHUDRAFT_253684 [Emiliania huxleyi CCMP1516]|uniref:Leucine-rich repeat domain-containing protein n=2 Tax=Emiliania huxleyi TaxID=2903 RepID=A0A0D3K4B3_EMIH1|nr:hypothetical protein EMIHUDRAFT_253684 [Emiliania huxleyi CCMP1516]EOD30598.1 hypothetical protein EMIHUDRAFT_253684 [Emiliania huxleyi CCMP1516]|eukprot:XP_005783027.1 hypothetical protein EMIHUDRAFT_253684 [Emiliania huxleyi CCMP1516]
MPNTSSLVRIDEETLPPAVARLLLADAFLRCTSLSSVALPDGLEHAFFDCSSLRRLTFPAHNSRLAQLQNLGYQAFGGCSSLATATLPLDADANDLDGTAEMVKLVAFCPTTTVLRLSPARMRAQERLRLLYQGVLAYKRCRPLLLGWLERAQIRLDSYGLDGAARQRDREEFESEFANLTAT